jgi:hypothetical protein
MTPSTDGLAKRAVVAVVSALLVVTAGATPAFARPATVSCGDTITATTVLHQDVGPCPGNGVIVGADRVVLNLNGFRIFGSEGPVDGIGVYVLGRSGVKVLNGTVSDFEIGVAIEGGDGNTVQRIVAENNYGQSGTSRGGDGIAILSSSGNRINRNVARDNGPFSGIGIYSRVDGDHSRATSGPSTDNVVERNEVVGNVRSRSGVPEKTDNDGIRMENDGERNQILRNVVRDNGLDGIAVFADNFDHVIQGNTVSGNGFFRETARRGSGIIVFNRSKRITVEDNTVTGNADNGISIRGPLPFGGGIPGALDNVIRGNTATGNAALPTLPSRVFGPAFDLHDGNPDCDNNEWFANTYGTASQECVTAGGNQV